VLKCEPQPKTQPQHTTTNMSSHRPTLQQLCPYLSMGRAKLPPNHCAAASLQGCAGWEPSGWRLPALIHCLGRRNGSHQKRYRGTGRRPSVDVVHLNNTTTIWKTASAVGGGMRVEKRPGWNVWGGRYPIIWGVELSNQKIKNR
jgi:hypothetical protein